MSNYLLVISALFFVSIFGLVTANIGVIALAFAGYYANDIFTKE